MAGAEKTFDRDLWEGGAVKELATPEDVKAVKAKGEEAIVAVYAPWCQFCQAMEDGYILTNLLYSCEDRSEIPKTLQKYYRQRVVRTSIIQGLSRFASDLIISSFSTPYSPNDEVAPREWRNLLTLCWQPIMPYIFQIGRAHV